VLGFSISEDKIIEKVITDELLLSEAKKRKIEIKVYPQLRCLPWVIKAFSNIFHSLEFYGQLKF